MHALRLAFASALVIGLSACGSDEPLVMPDVTGAKLDAALSDIERAGFDDDPEVLGGGMFGVIDESNWTVCEQEPAANAEISEKPRLTVERSCEADSEDEAEEPTEEPVEEATEEPAAAVDITVDELVERLNAANMDGIKVGDRFRITGELVGAEHWGTGASGDFFVTMKTKSGSDLMVFVNKADAKTWKNGTKVEMIVEMSELTINGETTDGWLRALSAETLSTVPKEKPKKPSAATLLKDLSAYADFVNTSLGNTVIDSIEPSPGGFDVFLNPNMGGVTVAQAQTLISQWNENIVDTLASAGRGASDGSVKYYLAGQLVAHNKEVLDPWAVEFEGILDQ